MKKLKAVCAIVINNKNEILLIKRGSEPFKEYWALISGIGESKKGIKPEVGVIEEVNCDLQTESFKGKHAFSLPVKNDKLVDEVVVFVGKVNEEEIRVRPPFSLDFKWVSKEEIQNFKNFAFNHQEIIRKYFEN